MNILAILYLILMIMSIGLTGLAMHTYISRYKDIIFKYTAYMTIFIFYWLFCIFMIQTLKNDILILFFHEAKFIAIIYIPILFYSLSYRLYTKTNPSKIFYYIIASLGTLIFLGIMTNPVHHLFRESFEIIDTGLIAVKTVNGPLFLVNSVYGYILLAWSFILLLLSYKREHKFYRKREFYLILGALIPVATNVYFIFHGTRVDFPIDFTPLAFFITILIYYVTLFRFSPRNVLQRSRNLMINNMTSGSIFIDYNGTIFDINSQVLTILNLSLDQVIGRNYNSIAHPLMTSISLAIDQQSSGNIFFQDKTNPLNSYYLLKTSQVLDNGHHNIGTLILLTDVSELQHTLNQLEYVGSHDDLTGVYNRYYFQLQLKTLDIPDNYPLAVIVGDINGLKYVNDNFGHSAGDSLLVEAAESLINGFDQDCVVCRIGGDEFVILIPNSNTKDIQTSINKLESRVFSYSNEEQSIGISLDYAIKNDDSVSLQQVFKEADANMYLKKVMSGASSRDNNLQLLQKILSGKDIETNDHLNRTSHLAMKFASKLELDHSQTNDLILLSQLHDIGKTVIPDKILLKPASLDNKEWDIMKSHSLKGYEIMSASPTLKGISKYILHHHEHYNGGGYPIGLIGNDIPYLSRIITIIDAYDVMTNIRVYKKAMTSENAIAELKRCSNTQFDPELVSQFVEMVKDQSF